MLDGYRSASDGTPKARSVTVGKQIVVSKDVHISIPTACAACQEGVKVTCGIKVSDLQNGNIINLCYFR